MGAAGKHKKRCTGKPYTAQEAKFSAHKRKRICSNNLAPALAGEAKYRIIPMRCGRMPLCRWVLTRAGLWVRYHPQAAAFLFSRGIIARKLGDGKYLRKLSGGSRGLPPFAVLSRGRALPGVGFRCFSEKKLVQYLRMRCAIRTGRGKGPAAKDVME